MESCSAFDFQFIPNFESLFRETLLDQDYKCRLISSTKIEKSSNKSKGTSSDIASKVLERAGERRNQDLDSTFIQGARSDNNLNLDGIDEPLNRFKDLSNWKPATNVLKGLNATTAELFNRSSPIFNVRLNLENIQEELNSGNGVTMFYKAFDFGRRSWNLKVDIDSQRNVSLWLVERGPLMLPNRLDNF